MKSNDSFDHILVGVDDESLASDAVVRAFELAEQLSAKIQLVHAVDIPPPMWPGITQEELVDMHATALAHARKKVIGILEPKLREAGFGAASLDDVLEVLPGPPAKVLLHRAEESGANLLVIGPHAKRSLFDFGSTARAVLSKTNLPVWTQAGTVTPVQRILVPIDFSEHSRMALDCAHALARKLKASIEVLHCYAPPLYYVMNVADGTPSPTYAERAHEASQQELERWVKEYAWGPVQARSTFLQNEPAAGILEREGDADLIVMGTHGHTGLTRYLVGSTAYGVLRGAQKPVLVVPSLKRSWLLEGAEKGEHQTQKFPVSFGG